MPVKKSILFIMLIAFCTISGLSQNQPVEISKSTEVKIYGGKEYYIHVVLKGHTLYSLSKVYEISQDEIKFENPELKNGLFISQILKIPVVSRDEAIKQELRDTKSDFFYHIAKEGESFREIAEIYDLSRRDVQYENSGIYEPLKEGQYIRIPIIKTAKPEVKEEPKEEIVEAKKPENDVRIHIVKPGDNLYRMAKNYGYTIEEIKNLNPGLTNIINPGQRIIIPNQSQNQPFINHTVQRRERLSKIAQNYDVELRELKSLNPNVKDRPFAGQKVKIPVEYIPLRNEVFNQIVAPEEVVEVEMNEDSLNCYRDLMNAEKTYKVALMIPLYLEDVDSLKIDENTDPDRFLRERPFRYLQFYYGAMMAVDSLKQFGLNIDLHVYDVDNDVAKMVKVFNKPEIKEMDLIVGPFFNRAFKLASGLAKLYGIPIVNPMTTRSSIIDENPWVYKWQPTSKFDKDELRELVAAHFTDAKIFFVKHHKVGFDRTFKAYEREIEDLLIEDITWSNDDLYELLIEKSVSDTTLLEELKPFITIEGDTLTLDYLEMNLGDSTVFNNTMVELYYSTDSIKWFEQHASTTRNNLVITLTDDNVFALDVMTQLNIVRDTFPTTVVGMPNWVGMDNHDNEILMNLNVHTLNFTMLDYTSFYMKSFISDFRKKYKTEPTNYAFTAFDIHWYFLSALMNFGKDFNQCLPYHQPEMIQSTVNFHQENSETGLENKSWFWLKFNNYQLQKVDTTIEVENEIEEVNPEDFI